MRNVIQDLLGNGFLIVAAWMVAYRMPKRSRFPLRSVLCFIGVSVCRHLYFNVLLTNLRAVDEWRLLTMLGFAVLLGLVLAAVGITFECGFWSALFCSSTSYCIQHVGQRTYSIMSRLWLKDRAEWTYILLYVTITLLGLAIVYISLKKLQIDRIDVDNKYQLAASVLVIASTVVLDLITLKQLRQDSGGDLLRSCVDIYSVMSASMIFALQFSMISNKKKDVELDTIKSMLDEEREQYYFEKSMIDTINIKCHDIKHQLAALDPPARTALRDELRPIVEAYDSSFQTGNVALDVVLTRKNFNCKGKSIALTSAANGKCLNFMSEADIYSLFGNILDNAIDATEKLEDVEKRIISLSVSQEGYFIHIHAENYYSGKLVFSDGLPETTKRDTLYHGFGMKSIRMLVHKYNGSIKIDVNGDRFVLDIMFAV